MSSKSERQATTVWLLVDALATTNPDPALDQLRSSVKRLCPYVLQVFDRPMRRVQDGLIDFVNQALESDEDGNLSREQTLSFFHLLAALASDQWAQCPDRPAERKRNWRRLNNNIASFIEAQDPTGEVGAETGCRWADHVKEILRGES